MEQLQLLAHENPVSLPQEIRDELLSRMVEAIVLIFKTGNEENHDFVTPKNPS